MQLKTSTSSTYIWNRQFTPRRCHMMSWWHTYCHMPTPSCETAPALWCLRAELMTHSRVHDRFAVNEFYSLEPKARFPPFSLHVWTSSNPFSHLIPNAYYFHRTHCLQKNVFLSETITRCPRTTPGGDRIDSQQSWLKFALWQLLFQREHPHQRSVCVS